MRLDTSAISEPGIGRCQTTTPQALVASIRSGERELPASARHARFSLPLRTPFKPDDLVFHPRFGRGRIIEEWGSWLDVDPNGGQTRSCGGTGVFEVEFDTSGRRSVSGARLTPIEFAGYKVQA
jgi:hypothetical protein